MVYNPTQAESEQLSNTLLYNQSLPFVKLEWFISRELKNQIGVWYLYMNYNNTYPSTHISENYPKIKTFTTSPAES